jgi:hypothetical protein
MLNCILHTKAGNSNYYADRKRGTVDVWHDSQRWVFKQNCKGLKAFKRDIYHALDIFCSRHGFIDHADYCQEKNLTESDINIESVN